MADASPRTDISTDVDTDDKNQPVMFLYLMCCFPLTVQLMLSNVLNLNLATSSE